MSDSDEDDKSTEMSTLVPTAAEVTNNSQNNHSSSINNIPSGDARNIREGSSSSSVRNYRRMRSIVLHRLPLQEAMKNGNGGIGH